MTEVASFYRFTAIADPAALAEQIQHWCAGEQIKGSVLIASEGCNGVLAGDASALARVLKRLSELPQFTGLAATFVAVPGDVVPFRRLRVRVRSEIVTFGASGVPPSPAGRVVDAPAWHRLLDDPDVIVVDVRNAYETALGGFPGAIDPHTENFSQFRAFVGEHLCGRELRPVAMYCTGGIRCAKAGVWMREQGFNQVYELEGGVLGYLQSVAPEQNRWQGNCFVFDARVSVDRNLLPGGERLCRECGSPWRPVPQECDARICVACRVAAA